MNCKQRLEYYLRENVIPYQSQHHARAIAAQEVAATEHVPGKRFAKTVMVTADTEKAIMLVLPAPYHVNPEKAAAALGTRGYSSPRRNALRTSSSTARLGRCRRLETSMMSPYTWTRP